MMISPNKNNSFDLSQFEKIEDIIYLDEPILTHLVKNKKHFLLYLVDTKKDIDIYLLLEVEEKTIFKYITKQVTLRNLIIENDNFIFQVEQDFKGEVLRFDVIRNSDLPKYFLPAVDSYLNYEPSVDSYYFNLIEKVESKNYLNSLRKQAFYLKLSPTNKKYSDTIGFNELVSDLLKNISSSFKNFLKADFYESFKEKQTDTKKLNYNFNKLANEVDYRMVDLKFGSFEIGLAVDKVMKGSIKNKDMREWAVSVGYKFKEIVLDKDYDEKNVEQIILNYNEGDRKKIFGPIFKIIDNPNYDLKIKDSNNLKYSKIKLKNKSAIDKIIPPKIQKPDDEKSKEYEIIQITTVKEKGEIKKSIRLNENTLFESSGTTQYTLKKKDFSKFNYDIDFEIEIPLNIVAFKDKVTFKTDYKGVEFQKTVDSTKFDDGFKQIISSIYEFILNKSE